MQNKGVPEDDVERLSLSATRQRKDYEHAMTAVELLLLRSGITLTQIYSQQDLLTQKDKNAHLNTYFGQRKRNKGLMEEDIERLSLSAAAASKLLKGRITPTQI